MTYEYCPNHTYADYNLGICAECDPLCETCSSNLAQDCLSCNGYLGYILIITPGVRQCTQLICSTGQYLKLGSSAECIDCKPECQTCTSDYPLNCTACKKQYLSFSISNNPMIYSCRTCESFKGLKSPAILGNPCDGMYKFTIKTI